MAGIPQSLIFTLIMRALILSVFMLMHGCYAISDPDVWPKEFVQKDVLPSLVGKHRNEVLDKLGPPTYAVSEKDTISYVYQRLEEDSYVSVAVWIPIVVDKGTEASCVLLNFNEEDMLLGYETEDAGVLTGPSLDYDCVNLFSISRHNAIPWLITTEGQKWADNTDSAVLSQYYRTMGSVGIGKYKTLLCSDSGTTQQQIRQRLGEPLVSDESWRAELYRIDTFGASIYGLYTYDENDNVKDCGVAFHKGQGDSDNVKSASAGGFTFSIGTEMPYNSPPYAALIAPLTQSQARLRSPPPSGMCAILFAAEGNAIQIIDEIHVDGDIQLADLLHGDLLKLGFIRVLLPPGTHQIEIQEYGWFLASNFVDSFNCEAGEVIYMTFKLQYPDSFYWRLVNRQGELVLSSTVPDYFLTLGEILWFEGR
jgi:hypothetical protein